MMDPYPVFLTDTCGAHIPSCGPETLGEALLYPESPHATAVTDERSIYASPRRKDSDDWDSEDEDDDEEEDWEDEEYDDDDIPDEDFDYEEDDDEDEYWDDDDIDIEDEDDDF